MLSVSEKSANQFAPVASASAAGVKSRTRPLAFSITFRSLTAVGLHVKPGLQHSNPGQTLTQTSSGV